MKLKTIKQYYTNKEVIKYLWEYHKTKDNPFNICIGEDEIIDIDKCMNTNDKIVLYDFRNEIGDYFVIDKKENEYHTLRSIFNECKNNTKYYDMKHTDYNDLVYIQKQSDIQYNLHFEKTETN